MSVEAPKAEETTLAPAAKPVESTIAPAETTTTPAAAETPAAEEAAKETAATPAAETAAKDEAVVEATPASEGTLGYKAPGLNLLKQLRYVKHFFWFSEEPLTQEALDSYVKNEKSEAHHKAAWAQETGKGCLFVAKRAEDKATPSGIILLAEATAVTKSGFTDFSFKVGNHTHKFEAQSAAERDSWVVAIKKIIDESKDLKADVTGRESYKKTVEGYSSSPAAIGASASPKKSLDANTATAAATAEASSAAKPEEASASSAEDANKNKGTEKKSKKERSQSRKRNSVFGLFGKKDEDKAAEKEVKKAEAEHKKEEAKTEHDASKGKEAVEAAAVAAAPAAVVAAVEKEEDKKEETPAEKAEEVTTPTEKKSKRASVFGGFFGKSKVTGPSQEKTLDEAGPAVPAKDETSAVSETAPKLDEPIDTKPIDAAAFTAPVDNPESTAAPDAAAPVAAEEPKTAEPAAVAETATSPKTEKKGFLAGLIKKHDKKEEAKEETKTNEDAAKDTATPADAAETAAAEPAAETAAKEAEAPKEERPAREKRRASFFSSLGTLKRKTEKSPGPESADEQKTETKREKSPLPSKIGGLFRRPSKATKPEEPAKEVKTEEAAADATKTEAAAEAPKTEEAPAATETPAAAEPKGDSEIVGDVVPDNLHATAPDAAAQKPEEVKATV